MTGMTVLCQGLSKSQTHFGIYKTYLYSSMTGRGLSRFDNIKFHLRCLFRIQGLLMRRKIRLPEYFRKSKFFIDGIFRAVLRS